MHNWGPHCNGESTEASGLSKLQRLRTSNLCHPAPKTGWNREKPWHLMLAPDSWRCIKPSCQGSWCFQNDWGNDLRKFWENFDKNAGFTCLEIFSFSFFFNRKHGMMTPRSRSWRGLKAQATFGELKWRSMGVQATKTTCGFQIYVILLKTWDKMSLRLARMDTLR